VFFFFQQNLLKIYSARLLQDPIFADAAYMIDQFGMTNLQVNQFLKSMSLSYDEWDLSAHNISCHWLQTNFNTWKYWVRNTAATADAIGALYGSIGLVFLILVLVTFAVVLVIMIVRRHKFPLHSAEPRFLLFLCLIHGGLGVAASLALWRPALFPAEAFFWVLGWLPLLVYFGWSAYILRFYVSSLLRDLIHRLQKKKQMATVPRELSEELRKWRSRSSWLFLLGVCLVPFAVISFVLLVIRFVVSDASFETAYSSGAGIGIRFQLASTLVFVLGWSATLFWCYRAYAYRETIGIRVRTVLVVVVLGVFEVIRIGLMWSSQSVYSRQSNVSFKFPLLLHALESLLLLLFGVGWFGFASLESCFESSFSATGLFDLTKEALDVKLEVVLKDSSGYRFFLRHCLNERYAFFLFLVLPLFLPFLASVFFLSERLACF
jgi:hypothetical protein